MTINVFQNIKKNINIAIGIMSKYCKIDFLAWRPFQLSKIVVRVRARPEGWDLLIATQGASVGDLTQVQMFR